VNKASISIELAKVEFCILSYVIQVSKFYIFGKFIVSILHYLFLYYKRQLDKVLITKQLHKSKS